MNHKLRELAKELLDESTSGHNTLPENQLYTIQSIAVTLSRIADTLDRLAEKKK